MLWLCVVCLQPFIADILPPILRGLADEAENVRDAALKAGQMIVNNYCDTSVELFLPQVCRALVTDILTLDLVCAWIVVWHGFAACTLVFDDWEQSLIL
jgi:hypothetical protein